jgi:hypothetical protein
MTRVPYTGDEKASLARIMTEHPLGGGNVAAGIVRVGDTRGTLESGHPAGSR